MATPPEIYMHRCLQLALLGQGRVAPNPMVGAVLVHQDRIIGEGWHQQYGGPHAEVNCLRSVAAPDQHLIASSTLYVSLEPCAHFGKTPPCADLVVANNIKKVVVGCRDPFPLVAGKGIERLRNAGIEVELGILEKECLDINKRFFQVHTHNRPYVVLKWAQSGDGKIGSGEGTARLLISGAESNREVHKWRSEEAAILVGTRTALVDDPSLTVRLWPGPQPVRLVIDRNLKLPSHLKLFDGEAKTIVFNLHRHTINSDQDFRNADHGVYYFKLREAKNIPAQILDTLYLLKLQSLLVEGGSIVLQSFIDAGLWHEARIITNDTLMAGEGTPAPVLRNQQFVKARSFGKDTIRYFRHP